MAYTPKPAAPRNLREFFHWVYRELGLAGNETQRVEDEGKYSYALAAYGGIVQKVQSAFTLDTNWNTIVTWDAGSLTEPRGVIQNFAGNGLVIEYSGVWSLNLIITMTFDEANHGRNMFMRLFNETQGFGSVDVHFSVARNQPGQTLAVAILVEPGQAGSLFAETLNISDNIQVQLMADEVFPATVIEKGAFQLNLVSQYDAAFP